MAWGKTLKCHRCGNSIRTKQGEKAYPVIARDGEGKSHAVFVCKKCAGKAKDVLELEHAALAFVKAFDGDGDAGEELKKLKDVLGERGVYGNA